MKINSPKILLGSVLLASSVAANSAPVDLLCEIYNKPTDKTLQYKVTLDEAAKTATFISALSETKVSTLPAQFTQTLVLFKWTFLSLEFTYQVDRVTMQFTETAPNKVSTGTCKIAPTVDRKF